MTENREVILADFQVHIIFHISCLCAHKMRFSVRLEWNDKQYFVSVLLLFQACTGIEDVAEAIYHLDETNWDLLVSFHFSFIVLI